MSIFFSFCGGVALPPTGRSLKYIFQYKQCNAEFYTYCHNLFFPGVGVPKCKESREAGLGEEEEESQKTFTPRKKKITKEKENKDYRGKGPGKRESNLQTELTE